MSKETFKAFARSHPELATSVMKNNATWQKLMNYMKYMVKTAKYGMATFQKQHLFPIRQPPFLPLSKTYLIP